MSYIEIKQIKPLIDKGHKTIKITSGENHQMIFLRNVQIGYGIRTFFICPCCGENAYKLYLDDFGYKCVHCTSLNPYSDIQNTTKGGADYLEYKMWQFANRHEIGDFQIPFNYANHPKPKWKHHNKWNKNLAIMQALENMRQQSIFFKQIWNQQTIKSIENGRNKFLSLSLSDLKRYYYPFDTGM